MAKTWHIAGKARNDFADMIESLTEEQLNSPTLCDKWTPKHILAHLVVFVNDPLPTFFLNIAKHKFNFDAASVAAAQKTLDAHSVEELVSILRTKSTKPAIIPTFPEGLSVADTAVHTQDVRRSVNAEGKLDEEVLQTALTFLTTNSKAQKIFEIPKLDSLAFEATDSNYTSGDGALISGEGEAIILALMGRPTLDELTGEGVAKLRELL